VEYSATELLAITASRKLQDGKIVFAGVGTSLLASVLARATHAPHLSIVVEGGVIGADVAAGKLPISTNEMRAGRRALMLLPITDVFLYAQRGFFNYGLLGGAQIDRYGNLNTSVIGPVERPKVRLPGSGGANDIISHCREVFIVTTHERRRFVEQLDFITSPGHVQGNGSRQRAGLLFGDVTQVITNLAVMTFHPATKRMQLAGLQPGVSVQQVRDQTGFELGVTETLEQLPPPTEAELEILRRLDPGRLFTR
jgi:glutaconate CoA-transferase subunit B